MHNKCIIYHIPNLSMFMGIIMFAFCQLLYRKYIIIVTDYHYGEKSTYERQKWSQLVAEWAVMSIYSALTALVTHFFR